jgi:acyl-CoA thioester hydrolase
MLAGVRTTLEPSLDPGAYPFAQTVRVRFAETDAMGVAHHASYLPWLEEARVAYLRDRGHPYTAVRAEGYDIAVVECHVRYRLPALFEDQLAVHCLVAPPAGATFEIGYLIRRGGEAVATAVTVHAYLESAGGRPRRPPDWVRDISTPSN